MNQAAALAARSIPPRIWIGVLAAGLVLGAGHALYVAAGLWETYPRLKWQMVLIVGTRWTVLFGGAACIWRFAWALAETIRGAKLVTAGDQLVVVVAVTVAGAVLVDPVALRVCQWVQQSLAPQVVPFWAGQDWLGAMMRLWSLGVPSVLVVAGMVTYMAGRAQRERKARQLLQSAQVQLLEAQRSALSEELHATEASLEPGLLFGTLRRIEECFESPSADGLLVAFIRYLRAAVPGAGEGATLGQQIELVHAYAALAALLRGGMTVHAGCPAHLAGLPFAPGLLLPLAAAALQEPGLERIDATVESSGDGIAIEMKAAPVPGDAVGVRRVVERQRRRLAALYGETARLETVHGGEAWIVRIEIASTRAAWRPGQ